jgi:hypothetical protein
MSSPGWSCSLALSGSECYPAGSISTPSSPVKSLDGGASYHVDRSGPAPAAAAHETPYPEAKRRLAVGGLVAHVHAGKEPRLGARAQAAHRQIGRQHDASGRRDDPPSPAPRLHPVPPLSSHGHPSAREICEFFPYTIIHRCRPLTGPNLPPSPPALAAVAGRAWAPQVPGEGRPDHHGRDQHRQHQVAQGKVFERGDMSAE